MTASGAVQGQRRSWYMFAGGVLEAVEGSPGRREQQQGTGTLISSLRDPLRAAAVDVNSGRSEKGLSIWSRLQGPPHDC
ncbi:UNVERIFIED_CONTAM: hypothetical protein Sangu_2569900 [Sesamum angustifolium]|uniref:Uncharacterized protein n=1 Tax=Sesamum angustifolium TaxID=2727405 RepID=A0AAW2J7T4_9LAMI